jgi:hypothetical protein
VRVGVMMWMLGDMMGCGGHDVVVQVMKWVRGYDVDVGDMEVCCFCGLPRAKRSWLARERPGVDAWPTWCRVRKRRCYGSGALGRCTVER